MNHLYILLLTVILGVASSGATWSQSDQNTVLGYQTGNVNLTGGSNTLIGYQSGMNTTSGSSNVFIGNQVGFSNTTGYANVFIGNRAGYSNINSVGNLFLGSQTGYSNSTGSYNLFIGNSSGQNNTLGLGNTFIGDGSGYGNVSGVNNTYIGRAVNFSGNEAGQNNTFIGFQARTNGVTVNNSTAIGVNAIVTQSNSVIIGSPGIKVGIGNSAPNNTLEITNGTANQSGLRFTNLTSNSPASITNQYKFLTVNASGDVVLGSLNSSTRLGAVSDLWEASGENIRNINGTGVIIGQNVTRTPSGYKLFVEDGILTEKVKVAVKSTADWSDRVFEKGYYLKSLPQVEGYLKTNKHLPGIPSAWEMVKQGNDFHKTDALLLEKIEELTLYLIEQHKTLASIRQENRQMRKEIHVLKSKRHK